MMHINLLKPKIVGRKRLQWEFNPTQSAWIFDDWIWSYNKKRDKYQKKCVQCGKWWTICKCRSKRKKIAIGSSVQPLFATGR